MSENNEEKFDLEGFNRLKGQMEQYEATMRERLGKFDINEILRHAKDLRNCFIEGLGEVKYVILSEAEIAEIGKKYPDDKREQNMHALLRAMAAADSEITLEKLKALPYDVSRALQEAVLNAGFLPVKKMSKPGLIAPQVQTLVSSNP